MTLPDLRNRPITQPNLASFPVMSSSPSDPDPGAGSGLIDRWLAHRAPEEEPTTPESEPTEPAPVPTTELSSIAKRPSMTPKSRETVEAEILAALNRPITDPDDSRQESLTAAGEERRTRLARMVRTRIDIDPLTAPLAVIESYDEPPSAHPADTVGAGSGEDTVAQPSAAEPPVSEPTAPRHSAAPVETRAVDVFAPLREKVDPDAADGAESTDVVRPVVTPATTPTEADRRDAVVLAALDARLSEKATDPEPRPTRSPAEAPEAASHPEERVDTAVDTPLDTLLEPPGAAPDTTPAAAPRPAPTPETAKPEPREPAPSARIELTRRTGTRRLLGVLLLAAFACLCLTGWIAWEERTTPTIAVAACLGVITLLLWSGRSTAAPTRMVVENGVLDITRHDTHHMFDLNSSYTPIEVVGTPGRRGWKVLILRRSMAPFVIDSSMVDPHEFTEVLERFRPSAS